MGREGDRQALHTLLQEVEPPSPVVVVGMAGVGKTELAIQYGRSHLADYPGGVAWFAAANFGEAVRDWMQAEFSPDRDLRHLPQLSQQVALGWKEWQSFCGNRLALVMIDNVTNYREQVEPYLPQNLSDRPPFRFLLTSRIRLSSPTPIPKLEIAELDRDSAIAVLEQFAGVERIATDCPTAEEVCQRLANLPLALALVGCWLNEDADRTLKDLLQSLEQEGLDAPALERDPETVMLTAERGLGAAFAMSWQQLARTTLEAQQLARVLTLFAPVDLSWELVAAVVRTYGQIHPPVAEAQAQPTGREPGWRSLLQRIWNQIKRWLGIRSSPRPLPPPSTPIADAKKACTSLLRMSLLQQVDGETKHYRLHALLREFFSQQWEQGDREGWSLAFAQTLTNYAHQVPKEMSWEEAAAFNFLPPHLPLALQFWQEQVARSPDPATAERYRRQAGEIRGASFRLSQPVLFEAAFERASKTHEAAKAAAARGDQLLARQNFAQTLEDYRRVIEQARTIFPTDSLQLAGYLNKTAKLFRELGNYREGIPPAEEAVAIATDRARPVKLASYLNDLASLYYYMGRYSEAEPLYERSLAITEQQLGADHPHVAQSLNGLAMLYQDMGRYSEAEPLYKRSLAIHEQQLGADSAIAASLNNLADLYNAMGRYSEAEPLYERSLTIREQQMGADDPAVATILNNLAELYLAMGRYREAEASYRRSLAIKEKQLGADHPAVATSLNNLASLYNAMGRYSEAEPLYLRALGTFVKAFPENHPYIKGGFSNFAGMVQAALAAGQAEQLSDHPTTQAVLQQLRGGE